MLLTCNLMNTFRLEVLGPRDFRITISVGKTWKSEELLSLELSNDVYARLRKSRSTKSFKYDQQVLQQTWKRKIPKRLWRHYWAKSESLSTILDFKSSFSAQLSNYLIKNRSEAKRRKEKLTNEWEENENFFSTSTSTRTTTKSKIDGSQVNFQGINCLIVQFFSSRSFFLAGLLRFSIMLRSLLASRRSWVRKSLNFALALLP